MIASRRAVRPTGPSKAEPVASGPRWTSSAPIASSAAGSAPPRSAIPAMPHTSAASCPLAPDEPGSLEQHGHVEAGRAVGDVLQVVGELLVPGHLAGEAQLREPGHARTDDQPLPV